MRSFLSVAAVCRASTAGSVAGEDVGLDVMAEELIQFFISYAMNQSIHTLHRFINLLHGSSSAVSST